MTIVLNNVASPNNVSVINANFQKIEDSINDDLLKREVEVGEANEMRTHLDMNFNKAVNLFDGVGPQDAATVGQMEAFQDTIQDGADGADGATGATGATGPQGIQGEPGVDGTGVVATIVAGTNISVDATDPVNPIVSSTDTVPNKVDFSTFIQGAPTDAEKLLTIVAPVAFTLPAGLIGTEAYAEVTATAAATFTVSKNGGASLGTVDFATGTNAATFTFVTPTAFDVGDRLQLVNQGTADATLADISITVRGDL